MIKIPPLLSSLKVKGSALLYKLKYLMNKFSESRL
jgi:hypothetical protein